MKNKFLAFLLSFLIGLIYIIGPMAVVINCLIFLDYLWLFIPLIAIIIVAFILLTIFYYKKLVRKV